MAMIPKVKKKRVRTGHTEDGWAVIITRDDDSEYFAFLDNCKTVVMRKRTAVRFGRGLFKMLTERTAEYARIPKRWRVARAKIVEIL